MNLSEPPRTTHSPSRGTGAGPANAGHRALFGIEIKQFGNIK
jgi:hypothetical protein